MSQEGKKTPYQMKTRSASKKLAATAAQSSPQSKIGRNDSVNTSNKKVTNSCKNLFTTNSKNEKDFYKKL